MKKTFIHPLLAILFLLSVNAKAQMSNNTNYRQLIHLIEGLSFYKVNAFDTLYAFTVIDSFQDRAFKTDYQGWAEQWGDTIIFLSARGSKMNVPRRNIENIKAVAIDNEFIKLNSYEVKGMEIGMDRDFDKNYLLGLWLEQKGKTDIAKLMLPPYHDSAVIEKLVISDFGTKYYTAMLVAFCVKRNYPEAITYGNHLGNAAFKGYQYQQQAITLTRQLKSRSEDFKTLIIPRKPDWDAIKQKLNRTEQIKYLADRLKLINCIQPGQPAGISYTDYQFSISIYEMPDESYWDFNEKYSVINPYNELVDMKLNPNEVELLLPYLLDESYIPTYTYHRNFMSGRTLHKLSWVVNDLLYSITDMHFFNNSSYDSLDLEGKTAEVEKVRVWCSENGNLTPEERTNAILNTTTKWSDFAKALQTAITNKYAILLPVIVCRFNHFPGGNWPSHRGTMARVMFEYGNESYLPVVRNWNDIKKDEWVTLWTSLFLLKHDKEHYSKPFKKLEKLLKYSDGISYYPHAIDILLSLNNPKAKQLAEGILEKEHFQMDLMFDHRLDCVKKLLLAKSDYTAEFLCKKLEDISKEEETGTPGDMDATKTLTMSDLFVASIYKLKSEDSKYYAVNGTKDEKIFASELSAWLRVQYELFRSGKQHEINLTLSNANEPVWFLDAAHD